MLKLLTSQQIREADAHTIVSGAIDSLDLMESASKAFVECFVDEFPDSTLKITVCCGTGNNGGDGLAIARLLRDKGYRSVRVLIVRFSEKASKDFEANLFRLREIGAAITEIPRAHDLKQDDSDILIDALLGSGLNKALSGEWKQLADAINRSGKVVVAVDAPTGFRSEGPVQPAETLVKADLTITFQRPKINFLLPESARATNYWQVVNIGLDENFIQSSEGPYFLLEEADIRTRLRVRTPFSHKGTFGHALIIAGAPETMGAGLLCASASLYCGSGLTTACIPESGLTALNTSLPEVMAIIREKGMVPDGVEWDKYQAVAIGPGLGISDQSLKLLNQCLKNSGRPLVLDADALNLISANYELMQLVPEGSVLTPHVKEFDRLFGNHDNWWDRLETGIDRAVTLGCTIILKNRYTIIFTPAGKCLFNPTGSPAMSSGGMGDVLTGMITSFIAQGYRPEDAAILGVYLHGAGGQRVEGYVVPASRLVRALPQTLAAFTA